MVDLAILNIHLTTLLVLYAALVGFALGPDVTTQDRVNTPRKRMTLTCEMYPLNIPSP